MQIKPRLYPHPVLAWFSDDYRSALFQPSMQVSGNKGYYKIQMVCRTSSKSLNHLISQGRAAYAVHVECPSTRYRALFTSTDNTFEIDIAVADIDAKVEVCRLILASTEITNYASDEFHGDFNGRSFNLIKGDTLAVAEDVVFYADKKEDELARLPSIFSIRRATADSPPSINVDLLQDRIVVSLAPETHQRFLSLNSDELLRSTLCASVLMPALVQAIEKMMSMEARESLLDLRWNRTITRKLKELGLSIDKLPDEDSVALANRLIGDPVNTSLDDLTKLLERAED